MAARRRSPRSLYPVTHPTTTATESVSAAPTASSAAPAVPAPLAGVRVVSLAPNLPGPLAAARLVAMGASVAKVEPPAGDPLAVASPGWYAELLRGQEVRTVDLKDPAGRAELEELLAGADVLLTASRPSALARLGIPESVERHGLVHVEIVGFTGEREDEAGHDLTYQANHGTLPEEGLPRVLAADLLGGERAATAALAGLRLRDAGEPAARLRVVLDDLGLLAGDGVRHGLTAPGGPLGGGRATYRVYDSADGRVAVAALEPHFARRLTEVVGPVEQLAEILATGTSGHWEALGREHDIPLVAVRDPGSTAADPQPATVSRPS